MLHEPVDGADRVLVRIRESTGRGRARARLADADSGWHEHLHRDLRTPWPCASEAEFEALWPTILDEMSRRGISLGRGTYGGWDDGDSGLARAVWCLATTLRPERVVETGVARGVTSRIILEALASIGRGQLWSIDLPAMDPGLHNEIGVAVPPHLHDRWSYLTGTSRRRLPRLLSQIGPIDLFIHDSSHTERNLRFELEHAWAALEHGAIVADDVHASDAFGRFIATHSDAPAYIALADDGHALFGVVLKDIELVQMSN